MSRRRILIVALAALLAVATIVVAYPFIASLTPGVRALDNSWKEYDLSDLQAGSIRELDWFWVYRRTDRDFQSYAVAEPFYGQNLDQAPVPPEAQNYLRSSNREFFVFRPYAPLRGCGVWFRDSYDYGVGASPDKVAMAGFPHFYDPCEGRVFDTTGRLLARQDYPAENDLLVPSTKWVDGNRLVVRWVNE